MSSLFFIYIKTYIYFISQSVISSYIKQKIKHTSIIRISGLYCSYSFDKLELIYLGDHTKPTLTILELDLFQRL